MSAIDRLRAIANRAGRPTCAYSDPVRLDEQRESLDWIAHEAAEAIKELKLEQGPDALELGAAVRLLGLDGSNNSAPPICLIHNRVMIIRFYMRPGSPVGSCWVCEQCETDAQQEKK